MPSAAGGVDAPSSSFASMERTLDRAIECLMSGPQSREARALLIEAIADKEGLAPSDADVDAEIERIAESSQRPAAAVRALLEQNGDLDRLRLSLGERRTLDFLIERAAVSA